MVGYGNQLNTRKLYEIYYFRYNQSEGKINLSFDYRIIIGNIFFTRS